MKRLTFITILVVFCAFCVSAIGVGIAGAEDKILNGTVDTSTEAFDKNGVKYVRVIVQEQKKVGGVTYSDGTAVMFFGQHALLAKDFKSGDTFKAVVGVREWKGRTSYTVKKILP